MVEIKGFKNTLEVNPKDVGEYFVISASGDLTTAWWDGIEWGASDHVTVADHGYTYVILGIMVCYWAVIPKIDPLNIP